MIAYRITKSKYKNNYSGVGGTLSYGKWHHEPVPIVYASQATILAATELMVNSKVLPNTRFVQSYDIPKSEILNFKDITTIRLPKKWYIEPRPESCNLIRKIWMNDSKKAALIVPSVLTPTEMNILINPLFLKSDWIKADPFSFHFDKRLSIPSKSKPDGKENETRKIIKMLRRIR